MVAPTLSASTPPLDFAHAQRRLRARMRSNATMDAASRGSTEAAGGLMEYRAAEKKFGTRLLSSLTFDVNQRLRGQLAAAVADAGGRRHSAGGLPPPRTPQNAGLGGGGGGVHDLFNETKDSFWVGSGYGADERADAAREDERLVTLDELTSALSALASAKKTAERDLGQRDDAKAAQAVAAERERALAAQAAAKQAAAGPRSERMVQTSAEQRIMHRIHQIKASSDERAGLRHRVATIKREKKAMMETLKLQHRDMITNNILVMRTFTPDAALERVAMKEEERVTRGVLARRTCQQLESSRRARIQQNIAYKDTLGRSALDPSEQILQDGVLLLWHAAVVQSQAVNILARAVNQYRSVNNETTKAQRIRERVTRLWAKLRSTLIPIRICLQIKKLMDLSAQWTQMNARDMTPGQIVASLPQQQLLKLVEGVRAAQRHFRARKIAQTLFKLIFCHQMQDAVKKLPGQEPIPLQFVIEHVDTEYDARRRKLDADLRAWREENAMQRIQQQAVAAGQGARSPSQLSVDAPQAGGGAKAPRSRGSSGSRNAVRAGRIRPYFGLLTPLDECEQLLDLSRVSMAERMQAEAEDIRAANPVAAEEEIAALAARRLWTESARVAGELNMFLQPGIPEFAASDDPEGNEGGEAAAQAAPVE